jgi:Ca2+-binding EF-hand superfamily protein
MGAIKAEWNAKREEKLFNEYKSYVKKDGVLSPDEVQKCIKGLGYNLTLQEAQGFMQMIDKDRSGSISWEEFRDGVKQFVQTHPKPPSAGKGDKKEKKEKKEKKGDKKEKKK